MYNVDHMEFLISVVLLVVAFSISYFVLLFLFPYFFENRLLGTVSLVAAARSLFIMFALVLVGYIVVFSISDPVLANRFQHGFCGGFLTFLLCFVAARDSSVNINRFQFFIFSVLVVTTLGVGNEILEYFLHNYTSLVMTTYINDTWLDLISNTVGVLLAGTILTPFLSKNIQVKNVFVQSSI
jgi:hypothetical protein